jgi:hypothetical protein
MKRLLSKKRGLVVAVALMAMVVPGVTYARDGAAEEVESPETHTTVEMEQHERAAQSAKDKAQAARETASDRVLGAKARLEDAKLKRCEAKQKAIVNIMTRISDRGQKQLDLFSTIADRVEAFYTEKGNTLENYDSLVAEVDAKKAAAQTVVDDIQSADTDFACDGDDPHGAVNGFKASLKQEISALKEYRTAVKNLIAGVKSAQTDKTPKAASEGVQE